AAGRANLCRHHVARALWAVPLRPRPDRHRPRALPLPPGPPAPRLRLLRVQVGGRPGLRRLPRAGHRRPDDPGHRPRGVRPAPERGPAMTIDGCRIDAGPGWVRLIFPSGDVLDLTHDDLIRLEWLMRGAEPEPPAD